MSDSELLHDIATDTLLSLLDAVRARRIDTGAQLASEFDRQLRALYETAMQQAEQEPRVFSLSIDPPAPQQPDRELLWQKLREVLRNLPAREREILELREGLFGNEKHTLKQVGLLYGLSMERIRQIVRRALRKLRRLMKQCGARGGKSA